MNDTHLYYFRCRFCQTVRAVVYKSNRPERCGCSGAWMTFLFLVPITTDEQRAIAAKGRVNNPHKPESWVCVRCGETSTKRPVDRVDGMCCQACYRAEDHPPIQLLTPEQIAERAEAKAAFRRQQDDAHEHAHQLAEQEQRQ